jgi:hypothetical protein
MKRHRRRRIGEFGSYQGLERVEEGLYCGVEE